nr:hypothetical protein [uncultured Undibacterium sp.]
MRWSSYLKLLGFALLASLFASKLITDVSLRHSVRNGLLLLFLLACSVKELIDTPANWTRAKNSYLSSKNLRLASYESFPTEFRGWIRSFLQIQRDCWRNPNIVQETTSVTEFTYLKNGMYSSLFAIAVVSCLGEIPFSLLVVNLFKIDPSTINIIHLVTILTAIFTITSLIGDKRLLGKAVHKIEDGFLVLQLGARAQAKIPLCNIYHVAILNPKQLPLLGSNIGSIKITPFDKPNLVLQLEPVLDHHKQIYFEELGSTRQNIRTVYLYVDAPEKLLNALKKIESP